MAIVFVLHEASRTGAPRVGGLIARELAKDEKVRVIVMRDGPLVPWLREVVGAESLHVSADLQFSREIPFAQRVEAATTMLAAMPSDVVYVNSIAASVFIPAARRLKRAVIVHIHEKSGEMLSLLQLDMTKIEVLTFVDGVVLAADELVIDIESVFGRMPSRLLNFGIAVDFEAVREGTTAPVTPARNALGEDMSSRGERLVVGMCGHASFRKGADIFLATAGALPQFDFLWIGAWSRKEAPENNAYDQFLEKKLHNFYFTEAVDNPYGYMGCLDIFFLSSREDPNPLVLAEAIVLNIPILCFSETTAVESRLGRTAILQHGKPNVLDAARVLAACSLTEIRSRVFRELAHEAIAEFDLLLKVEKICQLIGEVRSQTPS